jgi:hypothetical protein
MFLVNISFGYKRVLIPQGKPWTLWAHTDKVGEVLKLLLLSLARK